MKTTVSENNYLELRQLKRFFKGTVLFLSVIIIAFTYFIIH